MATNYDKFIIHPAYADGHDPKRSTARFCSTTCRVKSHRQGRQ